MRLAMALTTLALLGGCNTIVPRGEAVTQRQQDASIEGLDAVLRDAAGADKGRVSIAELGDGVRVTVTGRGLPPGPHGLHVHAVGKCEGPDFTSAGPHWNPDNKQHGVQNPAGAHAGDLPNLTIGRDGTGSVAFTIPGKIAALMDADGASMMVHAEPDDYRTDPSGNSGARIACAVLPAR